MAPIVMVTGKGGVGKTTVALGLAASTKGARLVQFDAPSGPVPSSVERIVLEADRCVHEAAGQILGSRRIAGLLLGRPSVKALLRLSDAVRVVAVLERVRQLKSEGSTLILDLPATGHALSWFRSVRALRELTRRGPVHDFIARIEDEVLNPHSTQVWVVSIPTPVALAETSELCATLRAEMNVQPRVVVNRDSTNDPTSSRMSLDIATAASVRRLPEFARIPYDDMGRLLGAAA